MIINKTRFHLTASEIAMGRVMRAPDHPAADEFAAAFDMATDEKSGAGAADDKGGTTNDGGGGAAAAAAGESGAADAGAADGGAAGGEGGAAAGAPGDAAAAGAADGGAGATGDGKGGDAPGAGADGAAGAAAGAADDKGAAGGKEKAPAAAAEDDDAILRRLAAAVKKVDEPAAGAADSAAGAGAAEAETPLFSDEETAKIEHFKKEWPEVAEAFDLQARAVAHAVMKHTFKEIGAVIGPMRETLEVLATRTHLGDLKEAVGDYDDKLVDEVTEWVKTQPAYLQAGMLSVIQEGTAEETADLVQRYREATGKQAAGAQTEAKGPQGGEQELSDTAKQAAGELAPVSSKRSAVQAAEDSSDFGAAFAKFADQV